MPLHSTTMSRASGHGVADVAFIPKRGSGLPGVVLELKWDKDEEGAIWQIKDRNYPKVLEQFGDDVVLAGVNYDHRNKTHTCRIECIRKYARPFK